MKKQKRNILATRDTTVGHWRFRGDLSDASEAGNHLTGQNTGSAFASGNTEDGVTAIKVDSEDLPARRAFIPAAAAGDLDFGADSFTIEAILRDNSDAQITTVLQKYSGSPATGYRLALSGAGPTYFRFEVGDGTASAYVQSTEPKVRGRWHYCVVVVDRASDTLTIYQDGASVGSVSIASVTGNLSNPAQDFSIQTINNQTWIDEICVSKEALTAAAIVERAAGDWVEIPDGPDDFMMRFLPAINHTNADLQQFLIPFNRQYLELRQAGLDAADLVAWDRVPERFITHMASQFGFPLIDSPFASPMERRNFLPWIAWIYRRKGTLAGLTKVIELLGFTADVEEVFPDAVPFIVNFHRCWSRDNVKQLEFLDGFETLGNWDPPLAYDSRWEIIAGRLRGTGNGAGSQLNAILTDSDLSVYRLEAKYSIVSGLAIPDKLGFYLKWVDADNYIAFVLNLGVAADTLDIERREGGSFSSQTLATVSDALDESEYRTGEHRLWIFADHTANVFTGGIDDQTLFFDEGVSMANPAAGRKGLIVDMALTVDWDDFLIQVLNYSQSARVWTDDFLSRKIQITLYGLPAFAAHKCSYLKEVLKAFVPAGTELEITI